MNRNTIRSVAMAACFVSMGALFSAPTSYLAFQGIHLEEQLVQQQTEQIQGMQKQLVDLSVDKARQESDHEKPKLLEALARYCFGKPKDKKESQSWLLCPAEGEVCDVPSIEKCADEHPAYYF